MKKIFSFLSPLAIGSILISLFAIMAVMGTSDALAADVDPSNLSAAIITDADRPDDVRDETDIRSTVISVVNYLLGFLGLVAVLFIIYAGFTMVTSQGDEEAVTNARKMIIYAIIGIIIIFLSFTIVNFVASFGEGGDADTSSAV